MTPAPDFEQPFDRLADLLGVALNPDMPPADRESAWAALRALPTSFLQELALSGEWQFIRRVLDGEAPMGDLPGDGPWTTTAEADQAFLGAAPAPAPILPGRSEPLIVETYAKHIKRLLDDQVDPEDPALSIGMTAALRFPERAHRAAMCHATPPVPTEAYVRRLVWSALHPGSRLLRIEEQFPDRPALLAAAWDEILVGQADLAIPPRLARALTRIMQAHPGRVAWFDLVAQWIEQALVRTVMGYGDVEGFRSALLRLRAGLAIWVRHAELTDPLAVATLEWYAVARFLTHADMVQLEQAWLQGAGDPCRATESYRALDLKLDAPVALSIDAVSEPLAAGLVQALRPLEQQALQFVRAVTRSRPGVLLDRPDSATSFLPDPRDP